MLNRNAIRALSLSLITALTALTAAQAGLPDGAV